MEALKTIAETVPGAGGWILIHTRPAVWSLDDCGPHEGRAGRQQWCHPWAGLWRHIPLPGVMMSPAGSNSCLPYIHGSLEPVLTLHAPSLELTSTLQLYILSCILKSRAADPFRWLALFSFPLLMLAVNQILLCKNTGGGSVSANVAHYIF